MKNEKKSTVKKKRLKKLLDSVYEDKHISTLIGKCGLGLDDVF